MQCFEFMVIPAPRRGVKARGARTTEDRFALALTTLMNELGAEGWDYLRADALPCDERAGLTGTRTTIQNVLVFRRPLLEADAGAGPQAPLRLTVQGPALAAPPRLGPAATPLPAAAPTVGPARSGLAVE